MPLRGEVSMDPEGNLARSRIALLTALVILLGFVVRPLLAGYYGGRGGQPEAFDTSPIDLRSIDVNRADAPLLETLPGIGPALAARMVEERGRNGPFRSAVDLRRVKGIGPVTAARIEPYLFFEDEPDAPSGPEDRGGRLR